MNRPLTYEIKLHKGAVIETVVIQAETAYDAQQQALKRFPTYKTDSISIIKDPAP